MGRRDAMAAVAGVASLMLFQPAEAAEAKVTKKVFFEYKIAGRTKAMENEKWEKIIARDKRAGGATGEDRTARIVIGLYEDAAPNICKTFLKLVKGELIAPCMDEFEALGDPDAFAVSARSKLTKRNNYRQCKATEDKPVGYEYSQLWRVIKDKRLDFGRINKLYRQTENNNDANDLKHDRAGLVSTRKKGGQFEFTITPKANPALDEENIVFGEVLEGMEEIEMLNNIPVTQGQFLEAAFKMSGQVIGDDRAKIQTTNRPLQKIFVTKCGVL